MNDVGIRLYEWWQSSRRSRANNIRAVGVTGVEVAVGTVRAVIVTVKEIAVAATVVVAAVAVVAAEIITAASTVVVVVIAEELVVGLYLWLFLIDSNNS